MPVTPLSRACYSSRPEALRPRLTTGLPLRYGASKPDEKAIRKRRFSQTVECCNRSKRVSSHFGAHLRRQICGSDLISRVWHRNYPSRAAHARSQNGFTICSFCAAVIRFICGRRAVSSIAWMLLSIAPLHTLRGYDASKPTLALGILSLRGAKSCRSEGCYGGGDLANVRALSTRIVVRWR